MGLDMYAFAVAKEAVANPEAMVDLKPAEGASPRRIAYWRKFNALHGWMESLYRQRGGTDGSFNCNTVRLTVEDLDKLEADINAKALKPVGGFFFGPQEIYPEDIDATRKFIKDARAELAQGQIVFYDSWW